MADDLSNVPATGGNEPAPAVDVNEAVNVPDGNNKAERPSLRESIAKAAASVSERDQGAAVLREGAGADQKLVDDTKRAAEASDRSSKGWETRRANQDAAKEKQAEADKNAELAKTIAEAVKPAAEQPGAQSAASRFNEAPGRLSQDAKAAWNSTPEPVKAEVHRAIAEMEAGITKHKEGSDRWAELAEFDTMARQHGVTVKDALRNYIAADQLIAKDPVKGIENVLAARGIKLRDFAAYVLDMEEGAVARTDANDPIIHELRQQVANLTGQLQQYQTTQTQSARERINADVAEFQKTHPRMADPDFESEMAFFVTTGKAKTLQEAYDLADRLIPAAKGPNVANPDPADQTRKAQLSLTGTPGAGSNPAGAARRPSKSIREAVQKAAQATGIG